MKTDSELQHAILEELEWDPRVDATKIGVIVDNGVVTLTGQVSSYSEREMAVEVAKKVSGLQTLADELHVHIPGWGVKSDTDIAAAVAHALKWDNMVPDQKIQATVRDGRITLEGNVDWAYQKGAAYRAVRNISGVHGVCNNIHVAPSVSATDVKRKITAALHRVAQLDAERISVEARDNKIVLKGKVRSWAEREEAEHAAWAAPGVSKVENSITVAP